MCRLPEIALWWPLNLYNVRLYQTLVLMSDLATVLDLQGKHDEALDQVKKAVELGQAAGHSDQHVLMGNMAGILMHKGKR